MKGWLFCGPHIAPRIIEKEDPKPGKGEVVVDIKAAGLCHSDVGFLENEALANFYMKAPLIFGHEGAGVISAVGEDVTNVKVGDRVGIVSQSPVDPFDIIGCTRDGCYATKVLLPADWCAMIPDNVSYIQGAAGTDAGGTSHHALFAVGQAKAGMKVGIIGPGGVGQFAARMAVIAGCEVYACARSEQTRNFALELGCKKAYQDPNDLINDQPELIIDFAGTDSTIRAAVHAVAPSGKVVLVGLADAGKPVSFVLDELINKRASIVGSLGGYKSDVEGCYKYFATGKLNPNLEIIKFDEIGEGLERLKKGGIRGRIVAEID